MKDFGIGDDYEIESEAGELYKVFIIDKHGDKEYKTLLSDKGTGTIHLMELLLKLATLYRKYKGSSLAPTIVIEEPEQNLHPKAQSLLTDMLTEMVDMSRHANAYTNGFQFIVETHSEYMIRQSQVRVKGLMEACKDIEATEEDANASFEQEMPFKTYYFPSEGEPYEMIYRKDGNFSNEFGKGFFDEANNLLFEII